MNEKEFQTISKILNVVCERATMEYNNINPDVKFCLYQNLLYQDDNVITPCDIVRFYNENWTGNVDFMHIPDYEKTIKNIESFPIILAYDIKTNEILGISTMQYNEITATNVDPYFPEKDAKYFSMTGVLTNSTNKERGLRGIGNKIYQIELLGALCYKNFPRYANTRIMCVIDCRNKHSIFALKKAADNLGKEFRLDKFNMEFPAIVEAYYYITDANGKLTEAPTLVMEVDLVPQKIKNGNTRKVEFFPTNGDINISLLKTVQDIFKEDSRLQKVVNFDEELGGVAVTYVKLDRENNHLKDFYPIITNDTEIGNDRVPLSEEELLNQFMEGKKAKQKVIHYF